MIQSPNEREKRRRRRFASFVLSSPVSALPKKETWCIRQIQGDTKGWEQLGLGTSEIFTFPPAALEGITDAASYYEVLFVSDREVGFVGSLDGWGFSVQG